MKYNRVAGKYDKKAVKDKTLKIISYLRNFINKDKPKVQFLYFHHVFEGEEKGFKEIIAYLKKDFELVSHSEGIRKIMSDRIDGRYASISFDDGLKNNLKAAKIMNSMNVLGCFFICPKAITVGVDKIDDSFFRRLGIPRCPFLSWEDVETIASMGHEIGGHTFSHKNLDDLSYTDAKQDTRKTYTILQKFTPDPIHFAWPFGHFGDINESIVSMIFDQGFASCASAVRGCHSKSHSGSRQELCIRRDHVVAGQPIEYVRANLTLNTLLRSRQQNSWPKDWSISTA